ncbi:protein arginine N-methyltransferase 5 [Pyxicephalus adspersus]
MQRAWTEPSVKMAATGSGGGRVSSGRDLCCVPDVADTLGAVAKQGRFGMLSAYQGLVVFGVLGLAEHSGSDPLEVLSSMADWNTLIVGKLSEWIKVDSEIPEIRKTSEAALLQELNFSAYLGLPAFLIPLANEENCNLARLLTNHIHVGHHSTMFWMRVPLVAPNDLRDDLIENEPVSQSEEEDNEVEERSWVWWHSFRTLCDYNKRIALAIEVGADLPSGSIIDRWLGEPIKAAILPTSIFLTNKKGFPVLSKVHQRLIFRLFKLEVQFVISGSHHHSEKDFCSYLQYLEYLSQNRPPPNAYEMFAKGYEDYLQSPLQVIFNACLKIKLQGMVLHPKENVYFSDPVIDNNRYCCLKYPIKLNTVLHGFAGYFETVLYKDVTLSICPETHSPGMFSWFPILFPIKQPIPLQEGDTVCVRFWRCNNGKKVWYEWAVTSPVCSAIHNPTGRSYTIGL